MSTQESDSALEILNRIVVKMGGIGDSETVVDALLALEQAIDNAMASSTASAQRDGGEHVGG